MWLFKTPKIKSKYINYYKLAHYLELVGIIGVILTILTASYVGLLLRNHQGYFWDYKIYFFYTITVTAIGYIGCLLILTYVSLFKKETLKFFDSVRQIGITFYIGDNVKIVKGFLNYFVGAIYLFLVIFLTYIYYLIIK